MKQKTHPGRSIKLFREMPGVKQESPTSDLKTDRNLKKLPVPEKEEIIDDSLIEEKTEESEIPAESFSNFDEKPAVNIVSNTFTSKDSSTLHAVNVKCTFYPIDQIIQMHDETSSLYERLLKEKDDLLRKSDQSEVSKE